MVAPMSDDPPEDDARRYHHGDLRRALIAVARQILETEGQSALSLRAVARQAKVSPAAPYHHFKDKADLLDAVAQEGWAALEETMADAQVGPTTTRDLMASLGGHYVAFARQNPALYQLMYTQSRDRGMPTELGGGQDESADRQVRTVVGLGQPDSPDLDLELAAIAARCAFHGLADLLSFKQYDDLKARMGGEEALVRAVLGHLTIFIDVPAEETP
jgi:AcrR family transcriptional regulator